MTGPLSPTSTPPPSSSAADRLDSWKEIAAHLKRDVRTVQRWEKEHGLPVRRHVNARQGSVFAYKEELDAWWNARRFELESQVVLPRRSPFGRPVLRGVALAIAAALVVAGAALALVKRTPVTPPAPMVGLSVVLGPDLFLDTTPGGSKVALSPDGSRLAFVGRSGGRTRLFLRRLDRFENTVLPGTDNGLAPFFSPDGRWIGFVTLDGIKRMAVDGATPELVCPAPEAEGGAAWLTDDTVVFGGGQGVGLMRVSARGGTPRALTHVDTLRNEVMHSDPTVLPGGRTALFTVTVFDTTGVHARIEAVSLESAERRTVLDDGELVGYVEGVGIIFNRGMGVLAASFDPERLAVTGDPVPVVHDADDIAVTRNGMIAYIPGSATLPERSFAWVDMDGDEEPVDAPPRTYMNPRLSPDGRSVAVEIFDGRHFQIWTYDLVRAALTQLTPRPARMAFWTPDSKHVVVSSPQDGKFALLSYPIDKSNAGEVLTTQCGGGDASFSSDGQRLFCGGTPNGTLTSADILVLSGAGHGTAKPFLQAPFIQGGPKVSPDDRWLAYMSDESGRWEVYVTALPGPRGKWQISTDGGTQPVWSRDGRSLFFRADGKVMKVAIERPPSPEPVKQPPTVLFDDMYVQGHPALANYDVSIDGSRLLMIKGEHPERTSEIRVLQGWKSKVTSQLEQSRSR